MSQTAELAVALELPPGWIEIDPSKADQTEYVDSIRRLAGAGVPPALSSAVRLALATMRRSGALMSAYFVDLVEGDSATAGSPYLLCATLGVITIPLDDPGNLAELEIALAAQLERRVAHLQRVTVGAAQGVRSVLVRTVDDVADTDQLDVRYHVFPTPHTLLVLAFSTTNVDLEGSWLEVFDLMAESLTVDVAAPSTDT